MDALSANPWRRRASEFWSWACVCIAPCGLCQETRTLALNRVDYGIWWGPAKMNVVPLLGWAIPVEVVFPQTEV